MKQLDQKEKFSSPIMALLNAVLILATVPILCLGLGNENPVVKIENGDVRGFQAK